MFVDEQVILGLLLGFEFFQLRLQGSSLGFDAFYLTRYVLFAIEAVLNKCLILFPPCFNRDQLGIQQVQLVFLLFYFSSFSCRLQFSELML